MRKAREKLGKSWEKLGKAGKRPWEKPWEKLRGFVSIHCCTILYRKKKVSKKNIAKKNPTKIILFWAPCEEPQ